MHERLMEEAELSPLDGEGRKCLLRDVHYLREEFARPVDRWRLKVIQEVLAWIAAEFEEPDEVLPSLREIRAQCLEHERRVASTLENPQ